MTAVPPSESDDTQPRPLPIDVVSIQSQVVYGSVGNSIAVPILRRFGLQVAAVPTALLSNTPHYPSVHGGALSNEWFAGWLADLEQRNALATARAVVVGFLGNPEQAAILTDWLDRARARYPQLRVHIDPVIGDFDYDVYADPGMIDAWRNLLPRAHGLTPNHFELERLSGRSLPTLEDCFAAAADLLTDNVEWVLVTSAAPKAWPAGQMQLALLTPDQQRVFTHPAIPYAVKGVGDLFGALLLARRLAGASLLASIDHACRDVLAALQHTQKHRWEELVLPSTLSADITADSVDWQSSGRAISSADEKQ